jgi:hypothetical protein
VDWPCQTQAARMASMRHHCCYQVSASAMAIASSHLCWQEVPSQPSEVTRSSAVKDSCRTMFYSDCVLEPSSTVPLLAQLLQDLASHHESNGMYRKFRRLWVREACRTAQMLSSRLASWAMEACLQVGSLCGAGERMFRLPCCLSDYAYVLS